MKASALALKLSESYFTVEVCRVILSVEPFITGNRSFTVREWWKRIGDAILPGDLLVTIEVDGRMGTVPVDSQVTGVQ